MAHRFASDLRLAENALPWAISSREQATADKAACDLGIPHAYASLDALLADPDIDIVYVATPNHRHMPESLLALEAGKAVLCEKPFARNAQEAQAMVNKSRQKGLLLMEALWTRFLPSLRTLIDRIQDGAIGDPRLLRADFGFQARFDAKSRLFDPSQGGGSLPDIGIYPLFLAQLLFGNPISVQAISIAAPTGVDLTTAMLLGHEEGRISQLASSFAMDLDCEAHLHGTRGKLVLQRMFHKPTTLVLHNDTGIHPVEIPIVEGGGYQYQANAAMDALRRGLCECPEWPHAQSMALMELHDRVVAASVRPSS